MTESKLDIYEFGRQLLITQDLDPVYVLLWHSGFVKWEMWKYLLAYFCFYHVGTSSWISETETEKDFWKNMEAAAGSKDYPRSPERRHFRGANAMKSVAWLKQRGVGGLMGPLLCKAWTVGNLIEHVQQWEQFGPWIAFKIADVIERLDLAPVDFSIVSETVYESPAKGAIDLWLQEGMRGPANKRTAVPWALEAVAATLGDLKAPPRYERPINYQEAETILCKYHSYCHGHYEIGEDIRACRSGLLRFARCSRAQDLIVAGRKGGLWS